MPGYLIAVLLCAGASCDLAPLEPSTSYPTDTECAAALATKGGVLADAAAARRPGARQVQTVCIQAAQSVTEVEAQYDILETAVVHDAPSADSGYVGVVEGGQRALVTGLVNGTGWVRVMLPEGGSGFVYADNLRRVAAQAPSPPAAAAPTGTPAGAPTAAPPAAAAAVVPAAVKPGAAARPIAALAAAQAPAAAPAPPPSPAPALPRAVAVAELQDCPTCPVLLRLPAGSFAMGSGTDVNERPVHKVAVPAFALGKYPVTVAEWGACAAAGACAYKPAQAGEDAARRPMANLSWDDAMQYVAWLSRTTAKAYRLPSEAEWEYAARARTSTRYSWGDRAGTGQADCNGCGGPRNPRSPADVAAFPANPWGLSGMAGGVAQWVEDCWHASYHRAPADGTAWKEQGCPQRVLRGGSWLSAPSGVTVSERYSYDAGVRYLANGMRVALSVPETAP